MAVLDRAYAYWKADRSRVLDRLLKDLSGKGHHQWVGTNMVPVIAGGALCCRQSVGTLGCYATTPDTVALSITGDIDIRVKIRPTKWAQPVSSGVILSKNGGTGQKSWKLALQSAGNLLLTWTPDGGTTLLNSSANVPVGWVDGQTYVVRVTLQVNNGSGGYTSNWYYSTDYDVTTQTGTWTLFAGPTSNAGVTSIFDSTATLQIGADTGGGGFDQFSGEIFAYELRNGINGTVVSAHDFSADLDGQAWYLDAQNNLWTLTSQVGWINNGFHKGGGSVQYWDPYLDGVAAGAQDVDLRVALTYATGPGVNLILGRNNGSGKNGWTLQDMSFGANHAIRFQHTYANGTTFIDTNSAAIPGSTPGSTFCLRVTLDADNGLGGWTATFYYKTTTPATAYADMTSHTGWTQLNQVVNTTMGAISGFSMPTTPFAIGGSMQGIYFAAGVWLDIAAANNPYMAVDLYNAAPGQRRVKDAWGKEWVLVQSGGTSNDPQILTKEPHDSNSVYLPGVIGNVLTTPHNAAFTPTDFDVRMFASPDLWRGATSQALMGVWPSAPNQGWQFYVNNSNGLTFVFTQDGTTQIGASTSVAIPFTPTQKMWVRVTRVGATGVTTFYWSVDYNPSAGTGTWTQIGTTSTVATGAIFASTAALYIGGNAISNTPFLGRIFYAELRNGVNGPVIASFDPSGMGVADTTYTDAQANPWTLNRSASGRKSVVVDRTKWLFGTDDYIEAMDAADFNAAVGTEFTASVLMSHFNVAATTAQAIIAKQPGGNTGQFGWSLLKNTTANNVKAVLVDAGGSIPNTIGGDVEGTVTLFSITRQRVGSTLLGAAHDGTIPTSNDFTTGSLTATDTVRIFRLTGSSTSYADAEFYGAAFFREALVSADLLTSKAELLSKPSLIFPSLNLRNVLIRR